MISRKAGVAVLSLAAAIVLVSCNATTSVSQGSPDLVMQRSFPPDLKEIYSRLGDAGGRVFTLRPDESAIRIYAFRSGRAAKIGHNHVLSAPQFTGFAYLPDSGMSGAHFDLEFRLDQLEIDKPEYRSMLGSAFSSAITPDAVERTRVNMLGDGNLQADRFPFVRIGAVQISGEGSKFAVKTRVELHGQTREMWIPLSVEGLPGRLIVTGSFVLRQSDFGAEPYSVAGGFLSVQDEVIIEFKLVGV